MVAIKISIIVAQRPTIYMLAPFFNTVWATWLPLFSFCIEHWISCLLHETIEHQIIVTILWKMRYFVIQFIPIILQLSDRYFYSGSYFYWIWKIFPIGIFYSGRYDYSTLWYGNEVPAGYSILTSYCNIWMSGYYIYRPIIRLYHFNTWIWQYVIIILLYNIRRYHFNISLMTQYGFTLEGCCNIMSGSGIFM